MFLFENNRDIKFEPLSIEHGYVAIIGDDLDSARKIFQQNDSPRGKWGIILVDIIKGYLEDYPTYFQIRNFYEIDLDFLLKNKKISYVEQVLGGLDFFANINQEIYKYTARVMYENKLYKASKEYLEKSKKIFYKDPELHFMLAKYNMDFKNYELANFYINECLKILPDYYPAKVMKTEIAKLLN